MKINKGVLFLLVTFLIVRVSIGQSAGQQKQVSLTYSIINNIEWPKKDGPFKVHIITTDDGLKSEFRKTSADRKVAGRSYEVSFSSYVLVPQNVDVIFVTSRYNGTIPSLLDRISGQPILFITDEFKQQRDVMINFLSSGSSFEFNRANINFQGLGVKSGMREIGGREIDIAKIFKEARDSIRAMERRSETLKDKFDSITLDVAAARRIYRQQTGQIQQRDFQIALREKQISQQGIILDSLSKEFAESEKRLADLVTVLQTREDELLELGDEIAQQKENVEEGNKTLEEQKERIAAQNEEIAQREERLDEMSNVVDSQQSALVFLVLFMVAIVGFTFLIFTAYRARKRAAKKLAEQKEDLSRLLDELQDTQSQLVQSEKMASLGTLTAGIAHEINNAINFVYQGIHVLSDKFEEVRPVITHVTELKDDENVQNSIKAIVKEREEVGFDSAQVIIDQMIKSIKIGAERTTDIVKGLRIFSRSETEKKTKIDIHNDIDVALLLLSSRHKDAVKIEKHFTTDMLEMDGFKGQLSQAFLNIVNNAIDSVIEKGQGKDGRIDIRTAKVAGNVEISIKDNGMGMTDADKQQIFDPFFTTKKVGAGTGLGLAITYGIVERHGGTITVNSQPGNGAEFIIKMPLVESK